jgi:transcriptional regulator with XRE-family HTH domain
MRVQAVREIANTVRGRRLELGMSQQQLATKVGVSRKWLNEFESGKAHANMAAIMRLLGALDLELTIDKPSTSGANPSSRVRPNLDHVLEEYRKRP